MTGEGRMGGPADEGATIGVIARHERAGTVRGRSRWRAPGDDGGCVRRIRAC
jgi:hypothetical protein